MRSLFIIIAIFSFVVGVPLAQAAPQKTVLLRIDDVGMNYDSILAAEQVLKTGLPVSISVIFASPWYLQAVDMLKKYPNAAIGVHLTLNSEWKNYKRQPILGGTAVPGLVDDNGFMHDSVASFMASRYTSDEIEKELRAQIERALHSGLKIDYVDTHMGMIYYAHFPTLLKLSDEYHLGVALHFGETYGSLWAIPIEEKRKQLLAFITDTSTKVIMIETHLSAGTEEMAVLIDANAAIMTDKEGKSLVGKHRKAELDALLSSEVQQALKKVRLVNYRTFIPERGLEHMSRQNPISDAQIKAVQQ